jgi:hypothetical protein
MAPQAVNALHASANALTSSGELAKNHTRFLLASWLLEHPFRTGLLGMMVFFFNILLVPIC